MKAESLMPHEDPALPNALTEAQRAEIRNAIDQVIQNIGITQDLDRSITTNIAEFESSAKLMLEKVRGDLTPLFHHMMDDLAKCAENEHLAFVAEVQQSFQLLDTKLRDTEADLIAWESSSSRREKLEEDFRKRQTRLDAEHQKAVKKVLAATEETAKAMLGRISDHEAKSESGQRAQSLARDVQALAKSNGQLKQALLQTQRFAQDIGLFNYGVMRRQILDTIREHI